MCICGMFVFWTGSGPRCPLLRQTSAQSAKRLNLEINEQRRPSAPFDEPEEVSNAPASSPFHTMIQGEDRLIMGHRRQRRSQYAQRRINVRRYAENCVYLRLG